ncbi:MAG: ferredoxin [Candidatus Cloacimonadota bacterium]|nr:MAG: ferredoxin [Candidatus Cloacimonadota bacterium]
MINFIKNKCTGCTICCKVCPMGVIEMKNKKAELIDYESCLECGACALNCEFDAIEVTKGTGCLDAIIKEDILKITPKGTGCGC